MLFIEFTMIQLEKDLKDYMRQSHNFRSASVTSSARNCEGFVELFVFHTIVKNSHFRLYHNFYRVGHLLADLGWVDLVLESSL